MNTKSHQPGEPRGPLPSGGKTPANVLSLEYPRARRARCGVQGFSPARPASRGTCRATAVKPRTTSFPSSSPAPYGRGVGCRALALLPAAVAAVAGLELEDAFVQVWNVEVWPELLREEKLRIGALEKKKVAQTHLAAGADQ